MEDNSKKGLLGGFEAIFNDDFTPSEEKEDSSAKVIEDAAEDFDDDELPNKNKHSKEVEEEDIEDDEEEDEEIIEPTKTKSKKEPRVKEPEIEDTEEEDGDDEVETTAVSSLFDSIAEQLGWELGEDEEKPKDAESIVKYFQDVIEESSIPTYANEEVKALDEFVRNGGNLKDFYKIGSELDIETADIEDEEIQKKVVGDYLREKGLNEKQIERKLIKYEDAGILEDEANDALEALREIEVQKKEQLLEDQRNAAEASQKKQQAFYSNVVEEINGMKDVRGIKIPDNDKKTLLEYIFKPDANGVTKYQKEYAKSVKNLIESAYFTMKGDALLSAAKNEGNKSAIKNFKESLRTAPVGKTRKVISDTGKTSIWDTVAQQLTTKK